MIPLFKVVSLIIRLFTKPMTNYIKASLKAGGVKRPRSQKVLIFLGQYYHRINIKITRSLSNMGSTDYIKPLNDEKAMESGAEFIGEFITYGTLLTWGLYEVNKLGRDTKIKEQKVNDQISNLQESYKSVSSDYEKLYIEVEKIREQLEVSEKARVEAEIARANVEKVYMGNKLDNNLITESN
ncbi:hypothetical protein SteCoe_2817 [Stentor coeruleus]|uniref:OPA3-like protein n=1 Tax=Stentor coeruleus TaxID=5963 RepID=A0A1R2CYG2_9CILI|nr:hypothetical protein SteCoe_2817 [Stentor coeruleus]